MNSFAQNSIRGKRALNSEINVTPFVDVMLVLLIIFMITSPMLITGIEVELPKTQLAPLKNTDAPLVLSVDSKGEVYIGEMHIQPQFLKAKLLSILHENKDIKIFIQGDKNVDYGKIMGLFSAVRASGFENVALVTTTDDM